MSSQLSDFLSRLATFAVDDSRVFEKCAAELGGDYPTLGAMKKRRPKLNLQLVQRSR